MILWNGSMDKTSRGIYAGAALAVSGYILIGLLLSV